MSTRTGQTLQHAGSDPSLAENVTLRKARTPDSSANITMQTFMSDIKKMFSAFTAEQDRKYAVLQTSVNEIKEQNLEIYKSLEFLSNKYEEMRETQKMLEKQQKETNNYVSELEKKVELLERRSRIATLEIRNVPKVNPKESKQDLRDTIKEMSSILNTNICDVDIKDTYRINTKTEKQKSIIVEFMSVRAKEDLLQSLKTYNRLHKNDKFNTGLIGVKGPSQPIYIAEYLTFKAKKLYFLARDYGKNSNFNFCWTTNGIVYLREKEGSPVFKIGCESDLPPVKAK